jgi:hypothetical protein
MKHLLAAWLPLLGAACGADPVTVSQPVGINLKAKSSDVTGTAISEEKGINTESGNPFGAFVTEARRQLGEALQPAQIEVATLELVLGGTSTNVAALEQIFTGDVDVAFVVDDSNNTYDVGHVVDPSGVAAAVEVVFDSAAIAAQDASKFLGGGFKVVIRGPAAADFSGKGAEADLQLTFGFAAFE